MKNIFLIMVLIGTVLQTYGQKTISGNVTDAGGTPIGGVTIRWEGEQTATVSGSDGNFTIPQKEGNLIFTSIGYDTLRVSSPSTAFLNITLSWAEQALGAVEVETGYYRVPQDRFTGSFVHIDNELLNGSAGDDILNRLEGVTTGLQFDRRNVGSMTSMGENYSSIRIRGESSINSATEPLIVVDNFPYEGELIDIDPADVSSITVLKDAAAASIWGARAGNGVIVITTKSGKYNQAPSIAFSSQFTLGERPDLYYNRQFLPSKHFIEMEMFLFDEGHYIINDWTPLTPVVESLLEHQDGRLSDSELAARLSAFETIDIREQASDLLYRRSELQQYSLSLSGGGKASTYFVSGGYTDNVSSVIGNQEKRISIRSNTTFRPIEKLKISTGVNYTFADYDDNGLTFEDLATEGRMAIYPYAVLKEGSENLALVRKYREPFVKSAMDEGLLNWEYRPLQDRDAAEHSLMTKYLDWNASVDYSFNADLGLAVYYQYQWLNSVSRDHFSEDSYYARDFVNRFTQSDGSKPFPEGGILRKRQSDRANHSARAQLNYNRNLKHDLQLNALAGIEIRQIKDQSDQYSYFGYDDEFLTFNNELDYVSRFPTRPRFSARIPFPHSSLNEKTDRFLSYYSNASLFFKKKYGITGSARWDASNLFGVKTRQKGVPLWSVGTSWTISDEPFVQWDGIDLLKLRLTYGYNGNINKTVSGLLTTSYSTDFMTGLPSATIRSPGNPQLKWERIGIWNTGLDFSFLRGRISGTVEYYRKDGLDLLGETPLAPSTGFNLSSLMSSFMVNYADLRTKGVDFKLSTSNLTGKLRWNTDVLFSYTSNKITNYKADPESDITRSYFTMYGARAVEGRSIDGFFSFPWMGLDGETGDPIAILDGEPTTDYLNYNRSMNHENLVYSGVSVAPYFGNLINTLSLNNFSLSANISWKAGHHFRRRSVDYSLLANSWLGHADFGNRWGEPGDENHTDVPSMPAVQNSYRDLFYTNSELLVENAAHVRLHDLNLSYTVNDVKIADRFSKLKLFIYARELGIIWRANEYDLDPDQSYLSYAPPLTVSFGLNLNF